MSIDIPSEVRRPFLWNGETWTIMPDLPTITFKDRLGALPPLWLNAPHPQVAARDGKVFTPAVDSFGSGGWISVVGLNVQVAVLSGEKFQRESMPINLVIENHQQAIALAESLIDAVHQLQTDGVMGDGLRACRQISGIAQALRVRLHDILASGSVTPRGGFGLINPYEEIGHLDVLEGFGEVVDEYGQRQISTGRLLALTEDLAEALVILAYTCYYTDYRKRVASLLDHVIGKVPACSGVAWSVAMRKANEIRQAVSERFDLDSDNAYSAQVTDINTALEDLRDAIQRALLK